MEPEVPEKNLNVGQQAAADGIFQFLFGDEKWIGISGPGGYGKTFLLGYLSDVVIPRYHQTCKMMGIDPVYDSISMTTMTNQAAEVLSYETGRPCSTVYSFMNLKVVDDYETGKSNISKTSAWMVHERKILVIDECSMMNTDIIKFVSEGTKDCKIIVVGDDCQLSPIGKTISPIYQMGIQFFELTEPKRTVIPEILELHKQLRNTVKTGEFHPIKIVPGIIDWYDDEKMEAAINSQFKDQTDNHKILAYTNERVLQYNQHIRGVRNLSEEYSVGEHLVNNNAIRLKSTMLSVQQEVEIIALGEQVIVHEIVGARGEDAAINLDVRLATLKTRLGNIYTDVPLPVDRNYFVELIKYFQRQKNWNRYFHLKNTYADLREKDASTLYKAQGSTYDTVFIDAANLSRCNVASQVARQLYVGASRPRFRIIFYGELAEKYGGFIFP